MVVAHDLDHLLNQPPRHLATQVVVPGFIGLASAIVAAILALRRHPLAPPASVLVGFGTAAGFIAVHLVPYWSAFSDPYSRLDLNALSWLLVALPIAVAFLAGVYGTRALRPGAAQAETSQISAPLSP